MKWQALNKDIRQRVDVAISALNRQGIMCWAVGGIVRSMLDNSHSDDIDLCTKLPIDRVIQLIGSTFKIVKVGASFGAIKVEIPDVGWVDVATFRNKTVNGIDNDTADATITSDSHRRDFTINAIYYAKGSTVDFHGGEDDLNNNILRCIGNPKERFEEDLLRVIRLFRFEATMYATIDKQTYTDAMNSNVVLEVQTDNKKGYAISTERIVSEFIKVFENDNANCELFLDRMWQLGIIQKLMPEFIGADTLLQNPKYHPEGDVWTHTKQVVQRSKGLTQRWIALFHDIGKPAAARIVNGHTHMYNTFHSHDKAGALMIPSIGRRLKFPNELINLIQVCTRWHMYIRQAPPNPKNIRKLQFGMGKDSLPFLRSLAIADTSERDVTSFEIIDKFTSPLQESELPISPILTGKILIERGYKPSVTFGTILSRAYKHQIEENCTDIEELFNVGRE